MNNANYLTFLTNNIKRVQNNSKLLSAVEYFRNKLGNNWILFLQETHSAFNDDNIWKKVVCINRGSRPRFFSIF